MATEQTTTNAAPTPERLLLRAMFLTMKPARQELVLHLIGETTADNVVSIKSPVSAVERNALVAEARSIAGTR